ncbi:MAG: biotin transporter BioY [Bacteroidetes bacterium]|nr:MAG: biotin transporter BioY [Bacteroidota bacterium]
MDSILNLHSKPASAVDVLRSPDATLTLQVLGIVGFALLTAAGSQVRLYVWEVPFTLQTLAVYGSGLFLGWRSGLLAQLLYLSIGLFLPVFAGPEFGITFLLTGVTVGYLIGFPLAAMVAGFVSKTWNGSIGSFLSLLSGSVVLFTVGVTWLHYAAGHSSWFHSIDIGWLRFVGVDLAKILLVSMIYTGTRRFTRK